MRKNTLFKPAKNERLARIISIKSKASFLRSIQALKKGGLTLREIRALTLAKNRAGASAKRRNISVKERKQMISISKVKLPRMHKSVRRRSTRRR